MSSGNTTRKRNSSNVRTRRKSGDTVRLDDSRKKSAGSSRSSASKQQRASRAQKQSRSRERASAPVDRTPLISPAVRHDMAGLAVAVVAIALFIAVVAPGDGAVTGWVSKGLLLALGVGAYIIPFFLLAWALSFFIHVALAGIKRTGLGLLLVIVAVIGLVALFTPNAADNPTGVLFAEQSLVSRGGYLGAGIAWVLITLFGRVIGTVVLVGVIIAGLFVAGLSVSELVERTRERRESPEAVARREKRRAARETADFASDGQVYFDANGDVIPNPAAVGSGRANRTRELPGGTRTRRSSEAQRTMRLGEDAFSEDKRTRTSSSGFAGIGGLLARFKREKPIEVDAYDGDMADSYWDDEDGFDGDDGFGFEPAPVLEAPRRSTRTRAAAKTTVLSEPEPEPAFDAEPPIEEEPAPAAPERAKTTKLPARKGPQRRASETAKLEPVDVELTKDGTQEQIFMLPSPRLLKTSGGRTSRSSRSSQRACEEMANELQQTLEDFRLEAKVVGYVHGPSVTQFKIEMPTGVRVQKIMNLQDDIALALAAQSVRVFAPIPGTSYVGVEVPNASQETVLFGDIIANVPDDAAPLTIAIGQDVEGTTITADLHKMPHLLVAGTTGSGKSVAINAMIMSILMRATPEEVRMILIDPKRVEFSAYDGTPHLYVPVVTEPGQAASALQWGCVEMERRFKLIQKAGTRNIDHYNELVAKGKVEDPDAEKMPFLVIIIDELADLMMQARKDVETSICRIAQLGRAAGIHLVVATQRPSTDIVTGLIKSNITNRMALSVGSSIDSRVILDNPGAEKLLGHGDMLLALTAWPKPRRIQGCFTSESEVHAVVEHLKGQGEPDYHEDILKMSQGTGYASSGAGGGGAEDDDPLIWEAAEAVISMGFGSTSGLQRRLKVGYARAGRIMDMLEAKGVVGPPDGTKPREVLVDALELETLKAFEMNDGDSGY